MRLRNLILTIAVFSGVAFAQGGHVDLPAIFSQSSSPMQIAGLNVIVCSSTATVASGQCSPTVPVFSDQALTQPITNLQTNGDGLFPFWISPGNYQYCLSGSPIVSFCNPFTVGVAPGSSPSFANVNLPSGGFICWNSDSGITRVAAKSFKIGDCAGSSDGTLALGTLTAATVNATTSTAKTANNIPKAEQFSGSTADVKITACLAAISSGGTCDARGFAATTQSIATTITVGANETLLFDPATKFQAATSSLNIFTAQPDAIIKGFSFDCTNQTSYTGIIAQNDVTQKYGNGNKTELAYFTINSSCSAVTGFTSLKLSSTSNTLGVSFIKVHGWRVWGGADGVFMTTSSTGFVNGNHFYDNVWSNAAHGWHITGVTGGAIQGNVCSPCSFEKDSVGVNGVLIDGTSGSIDGNQFYGSWWDYTTPVNITNNGGSAIKNLFAGYMNGTPSDTPAANNFIYSSNSAAFPSIIVQGLRVNTGAGNSTNTLDIFDSSSGATNPHKYIRVGQGTGSGCFEILNSAFGADIAILCDSGNLAITGTITSQGNSVPRTIASGTAAMTTAGILTGACGTTVTVAAAGVATTDTINTARNAAATIGDGGGLTLNAWPTSGNVNFNYCNSAVGTITPTAMTLNWSVNR